MVNSTKISAAHNCGQHAATGLANPLVMLWQIICSKPFRIGDSVKLHGPRRIVHNSFGQVQ